MYPGRHAATTPDKPAVIEAATGKIVTYRELEDRSVQFAHWLTGQGLAPGDHLAVLSVNDATVFEIYWGAVRSGMVVTFVNTHLTPAEVAYIVDDCDARVLVVSAPLAELATAVVDSTPKVHSRLAFGGAVPGHDDYDRAVASLSTRPPRDQRAARTCCTRPGRPGDRRASWSPVRRPGRRRAGAPVRGAAA